MSYTEDHKIVLTKPAQRQLQDKVIEGNINSLLASINNKSMAVRGWTLSKTPPSGIPGHRGWSNESWRKRYAGYGHDAEYIYEMHLTLTYTRTDDKRPEKQELPALLRKIWTRAQQPSFGKWTLDKVGEEKYSAPDEKDSSAVNADLLGYADIRIPDDWTEHFSHLYGLDPHIARIRRALEAGIMSNWTSRFHCALVGPPGCGKSDICQSVKRALGEDAVLEFDATATTAAGAMKELAEREILPRILLVEEIEKADEKAMSFLLSVLDLRSEIRKVTARATIQRDTKLFAIATVNDVPLFQKLQAGALESRFANKLWFRRPSREQLALILSREVKKVEGSPEWIAPTLDYCETVGITDPRTVTAICLCGREMLLTGEYQKMLTETTTEELAL